MAAESTSVAEEASVPSDAEARTAPIVVGVDGTQTALDAVAWAAREAQLCGAPLRIVHAYSWPLLHVPSAVWRMGPEGGLRAHTERLVAEAVETARKVAPRIEVTTEIRTDFPLPLLLEESRSATLAVIAASGRAMVADVLIGSLTVQLVGRAYCPVVVVRGTPTPERVDDLVVVGVDGSPLGAVAIEMGMRAAERRGGRLLAVHVVGHGKPTRAGPPDTSRGVRLLDEALAGERKKWPQLPVEERVLVGHPAGTLVELSAQAGLVVVGARGRGGFAGMLLGSVSQALIHHAHCPVLVARTAGTSGAKTTDTAAITDSTGTTESTGTTDG